MSVALVTTFIEAPRASSIVALEPLDARRHVDGAVRRRRHALGDLARHRILPFHRERDGARLLQHDVELLHDRTHRTDRVAGRAADVRETLRDIVVGAPDPAGELLDVADHRGKVSGTGRRARRLHGCVQRERIGLRGDLANHAHDGIDLAGRMREAFRALGCRLRRRVAERDHIRGLTDAVDCLGDRGAEALGRRAHRGHIQDGIFRDECRFDRLTFGDRGDTRQLARGLVHRLHAVRDAEQHGPHDAIEPADRILQRFAALLHAFGMRHVGAQPVALLHRALQHDHGARDIADLVDAFEARHFGLPVAARDRTHRFGDLHQRAADALRHDQHDAGEHQHGRDRRGDQPDGERATFDFADTDEFVAQRMKFADGRECADAPLYQQLVAP